MNVPLNEIPGWAWATAIGQLNSPNHSDIWLDVLDTVCKHAQINRENGYGKPEATPTAPVHAQAVTEEMVNRFLSWPLPDSVQPDGCIGRGQRAGDDRLKWGYPLVGTNLLTADQAREMLEHVLAVPAKHETAVAFWLKHAMGGLSAPVCFGCGQPWETWKGCTRHAELPDIYLCAECARNCKTLAEAPVLVYRPSDEIAKDRSPDDQRGTK